MKLYIASDIKHAKRWITFRELAYPDITVVSSWIDFLKDGEPNISEDLMAESWKNNCNDVALCDTLMIYHETGDSLRGALFEAGIALAMGKGTIFVGDQLVLGTLRICFDCIPSFDAAVMILCEGKTAPAMVN